MQKIAIETSKESKSWSNANIEIAKKIISLLQKSKPQSLQTPNLNISATNFFNNDSIYIIRPLRQKTNNSSVHAEL